MFSMKGIAAAALLALASPAAALTVVGGTFAGNSAGRDLSNQAQTSTGVQVFREKTAPAGGLDATWEVGVDLFVGDDFEGEGPVTGSNVQREPIFRGKYNSYLLHFDGPGDSGGANKDLFSGHVDFGLRIIAIITSRVLLEESDPRYGNAASYATTGRGAEPQDKFKLFSPTRLDFTDVQTGSAPDNVRVLVAVPVPAAGLLLLGGLGMLALARRRASAA